MKTKKIINPFLNDYEALFLYWNRKEIEKYLSKHFKDNIEVSEDSPWEHFYKYNWSVICMYNDTKWQDNTTVIHEVTHLVQRMLDYLNIDCSYNNTELMANLMSYYCIEAMKFYKFKK